MRLTICSRGDWALLDAGRLRAIAGPVSAWGPRMRGGDLIGASTDGLRGASSRAAAALTRHLRSVLRIDSGRGPHWLLQR